MYQFLLILTQYGLILTQYVLMLMSMVIVFVQNWYGLWSITGLWVLGAKFTSTNLVD